MSADRDTNAALRITALPLETAARILTASGQKSITTEMLAQDVEAGAPANADETLNLVHYAAWLIWGMARAD